MREIAYWFCLDVNLRLWKHGPFDRHLLDIFQGNDHVAVTKTILRVKSDFGSQIRHLVVFVLNVNKVVDCHFLKLVESMVADETQGHQVC